MKITNNINLGNLKFGVPKKFEVEITNDSSTMLTVTKLQPSCSACTSARMKQSILSPGQVGIVELTFTPGSTGINKKQVVIHYTENGHSASGVIKFTAQVNG